MKIGEAGQLAVIPYIRIYYDRGSGRAVLDEGPGTQGLGFGNLVCDGHFHTEYAPAEDTAVRPRFWMAARNVVVYVWQNTAYIQPLALPVNNGAGHPPVVRKPPIANPDANRGHFYVSPS